MLKYKYQPTNNLFVFRTPEEYFFNINITSTTISDETIDLMGLSVGASYTKEVNQDLTRLRSKHYTFQNIEELDNPSNNPFDFSRFYKNKYLKEKIKDDFAFSLYINANTHATHLDNADLSLVIMSVTNLDTSGVNIISNTYENQQGGTDKIFQVGDIMQAYRTIDTKRLLKFDDPNGSRYCSIFLKMEDLSRETGQTGETEVEFGSYNIRITNTGDQSFESDLSYSVYFETIPELPSDAYQQLEDDVNVPQLIMNGSHLHTNSYQKKNLGGYKNKLKSFRIVLNTIYKIKADFTGCSGYIWNNINPFVYQGPSYQFQTYISITPFFPLQLDWSVQINLNYGVYQRLMIPRPPQTHVLSIIFTSNTFTADQLDAMTLLPNTYSGDEGKTMYFGSAQPAISNFRSRHLDFRHIQNSGALIDFTDEYNEYRERYAYEVDTTPDLFGFGFYVQTQKTGIAWQSLTISFENVINLEVPSETGPQFPSNGSLLIGNYINEFENPFNFQNLIRYRDDAEENPSITINIDYTI